MKNKISVIILAAGKGSRMKSSVPKVIHKVAGKPLLLHVINQCETLPVENIYVILSKNSGEIKKILPEKVKVIIQDKQLGTAHALMCARKKLLNYAGKIVVLYGDVPLIKSTTIKKLISKTISKPTLLGFNTDNPKGYGRVILNKNKVMKVIEEKHADRKIKNIKFCNSGIFCIPAKMLFDLLKNIKLNPQSREFLLTDIFELAAINKNECSVIKTDHSEVLGINDKFQLSLVEAKYQNLLREKFLRKGVTIISPETVIFSHDTKISSDVTIGAFTCFGEKVVIKSEVKIDNNCSIKESIISEGSSLGPFCRLRNKNFIDKKVKIGNFVELKKARIGKNTKINHLTYIGDAIIGSNSNIGAGTITCNYDGKNKNLTRIGNNVFIGSNCSLIAPINISDDCFVAAGSTISKSLSKKDFSIARARQKIIKKGSYKFLKN